MIEARPERQYSLAAGIQCWPLDVSSGGPAFLVEVGGDQRFEVTAGVHRVIELLREGPRSSRDLVERLQRDGNESATSEKVSWLLRSVLLPRRIVRRTGDPEAGGDGEASYEQAKKRSSYLWAKVPLASPEAVRPLTRYLRFLFKPWLAAPILTLALGVYAYFYLSILGQFTWSLTSLTAGQAVVLLLVLNATTIFHELGHVSACRYFGSSHGKIGWGIYLFMFVLYADVSQIWRLNRRQRAVVDLGGIYFEVIATLVFFALLLWTGQPFFIYLFLFVNLSIVTSLNPVLRRDGYWLLADLAGEANLRDANMDALRYGLRRLTLRGTDWRPTLFRRPKWLQATILLYSAVTVVFSVGLVWWISKRLVGEVIPAAAALPRQIEAALAAGSLLSWALLVAVGHLALQAFFVILIGVAAWGLASSLVKAVFASPEDQERGSGVRAEWKESQ